MEIVEIPKNMAVGAVSYVLETAKGDRGNKVFELSNHLGNVLATVSDKKLGRVLDSTSFVAAYYDGQVRSVQDYYAFGWGMPSRKFNTGSYRHGFNGKENDSDFGEQLIQDYGFRIYNPSVGKFLSVDPIAPEYPFYTPYQFAGNTPIQAIDLDGLEPAKEDANYGKNVILSNAGVLSNNVTSTEPRDNNNKNWIGFSGETFISFSEILRDEKLKKIEYLVIVAHDSHRENEDDFSLVNTGIEVGDGSRFIGSGDLDLFFAIEAEGGLSSFKENKTFEFDIDDWGENEYLQIKALKQVFRRVKRRGCVILSVCNVGQNQEDLMNKLYELSGNRLDFLATPDLSLLEGRGTKERPFEILEKKDPPISKNWVKLGVSTGGKLESSENENPIELRRSGKPIKQ